MSSGQQTLDPATTAPWRLQRTEAPPRPAAVLIPFTIFCGYALLRWQTMLPHMHWRFVAMLGVAVAAALLLTALDRLPAPWPAERWRIAAGTAMAVTALLALAAMIALAGIPLGWVLKLRIALIVRTIGDGIATIPSVTVPYHGDDRSTRVLIALAGGILMLAAAAVVSTAPTRRDRTPKQRQRRLSGSAALLLVMALIPSVIVEPHYALLHGVIACVLLVVLTRGWRIEPGRGLGAAAMLAVAMLAGAVWAGAIHPRHGLLEVNKIVTELGPAKPATFDWAQTYGPLEQSDSSTVVLRIRARHPFYWKAEDLDVFNGANWTTSVSPLLTGDLQQDPLLGVSTANRRRWTETIDVDDVDMTTTELIAAGSAQMPLLRRSNPLVFPGDGAGTWTVNAPLTPGTDYSVQVYAPKPTAARLRHLPARYPRSIRRTDLRIEHHTAPALAPLYALAARLKSGTGTPYAYVEAVYRYLHHGFTYVRDPPRRANPIPAFLLDTKRGYCQQFAGAMALLLRMGGVPARVAVGFETGVDDRSAGVYVVQARDAHAWVEVWFPRYGWVSFDPTAAAGNVPRSGSGRAAGVNGVEPLRGTKFPGRRPAAAKTSVPTTTSHHRVENRNAGVPPLPVVIAGLALLLTGGLALYRYRRPRIIDPEQLTRELERAFARCRTPLAAGMTLTELERSVATASPAAAAYIASLRQARFSRAVQLPTTMQRRAFRGWLRSGRGIRGLIRALVALPPRSLP